jgi:glycosyltransferase involved in cell wall biosynthesis
LISQYFFPETGATSNRIFSLAKKFKEEGHDVRVISEKANHPKGVFFEGFEEGMFLDREYKGIPVTYSWVYARPEKGFIGRILFYVSFMLTAVMAAFRTKGKFDIVCASSPPLFVGISGWIIAMIKSAKFVFDVRDLWPDVAVKMGALSNNFAINIAERIERLLYTKADLITTVTPSFRKTISGKGADLSKIKVITNGTDPDIFKIENVNGQLRTSLGLSDRFYVSYVGNIGLAQGLEHIIESAAQLDKKGYKDIAFLIIGDGPKKEELKSLVEFKKVGNVRFIDRVSLDIASKYMNASDILLVPLANDPIYSQFIPSKLFDSMAASKPILLSVDGEARKIIEQSEAGFYYEAESADQLSKKIIWLKTHTKEAEGMGRKGRDFVIKNYSRKVQAQKMLDSFQELILN